jgi:hypothetical protein
MSVCCECCVLSGRGLCVGLITRPGESYRVWRVCDREASIMRRPWPTGGCCVIGENKISNAELPVTTMLVYLKKYKEKILG